MTFDALISKPDSYETKIEEEVFSNGLEIYLNLVNMNDNSNQLVQEEDLAGFIMAGIIIEMKEQLIEAAIERKDYFLFGMSKDEFQTKAYNGEVEDIAVHPHVNLKSFENAFVKFIATYQLMTISNYGFVENSVLQEVW